MHHQNATCALQQANWDSMLVLECEAKATEAQDHQAFAEAFGAAMQACPPESQEALLHPLQILTSDIPLAAILGMSATVQLWAVAGTGMAPMPPTPSVSETPVPQSGGKCWCHSSDRSAPTPKGLWLDDKEAIDTKN